MELPQWVKKPKYGFSNIYLIQEEKGVHKRGIRMNETLKESMITNLKDLVDNECLKFSVDFFTNHPKLDAEKMRVYIIDQIGYFKLIKMPKPPKADDPELIYKYKWTGKGSGKNDDLVICLGITTVSKKYVSLNQVARLC